MAHIYRLIYRLIVAMLVFSAFDASAVITPSQQWRAYREYGDENPEGWRSTKSEAIQAWCAWVISGWAHKNPYPISCVPDPARPEAGYLMTLRYRSNGSTIDSRDGLNFYSRVGCPENSNLEGGQCVCSTGYKEQAGQCEPEEPEEPEEPPDTPDDYCSRESFKWNAWTTTNDRTGIVEDARTLPMDQPSIVCMPVSGGGAGSPPGCKHKFTPQLRYRMSDADPWRYEGDSWALGPNDKTEAGGTLACVPGLDDLPKRDDPKSGCERGIPGQVNGVDVCIDPASAHTEGVDWTRVTDSNGNVKEQKTEIKCEGEKCTVTTTTKTPGGTDENTATTTTTRGQYCAKNPESSICRGSTDPSGSTRNQNGRGGKGDPAAGGGGGGNGGGNGEGDGFCKENPDLPICKKGSFSGSCAASFMCDGDAIQCAIAREQHIRNCKLFDDPSDESVLYNANKGKEGNQTGDLPGNETVSIAGRIDMSNALGAGSCVSDRTVSVWGRSVVLPFSAICPSLSMFGQLLVAVSLLLAARIVLRG